MNKWMKRPYPFLLDDKSNKYKLSIFVFCFVFAFLLVFKPFNIESIVRIDFNVACLIYSLTSSMIVLLIMALTPKLFPRFANEQTWTIGREFVLMNSVLILIGFANAIIGDFVEIHVDQGYSVYQIIMEDMIHTYAIGIFPVMVISFINYTIQLKRNVSKVDEHNQMIVLRREDTQEDTPTVLDIRSIHSNNELKLNLDELLYIMSDGNYVEFHLDKEHGVEREIQRNTLSNIISQLSGYNFLFQSHRAYIVNLNKVVGSSGNAQGYQLSFANTQVTIPVSRRNLAKFDELIKG